MTNDFGHVVEENFLSLLKDPYQSDEVYYAALDAAERALEIDYNDELIQYRVINRRSRAIQAAQSFMDIHWREATMLNLKLFWSE